MDRCRQAGCHRLSGSYWAVSLHAGTVETQQRTHLVAKAVGCTACNRTPLTDLPQCFRSFGTTRGLFPGTAGACHFWRLESNLLRMLRPHQSRFLPRQLSHSVPMLGSAALARPTDIKVTHVWHTCRIIAICMRHTCNTHAMPMQHTCHTHATHMHRICITYAPHMQRIYRAHATGMKRACNTHATHMQHACNTHSDL